jgi:hypothetical protein
METWFYTNTFRVRNRAEFEQFCKQHAISLYQHEEKHDLIGCFDQGRGLSQLDERTGDEEAFLRELGALLQEGSVAIIVDASVTTRDPCDVSRQVTYAVNSRGEICRVNPYEIFERAAGLGAQIESLPDMCAPGDMRSVPARAPSSERNVLALQPGDRIIVSGQDIAPEIPIVRDDAYFAVVQAGGWSEPGASSIVLLLWLEPAGPLVHTSPLAASTGFPLAPDD